MESETYPIPEEIANGRGTEVITGQDFGFPMYCDYDVNLI